MTISHSLTPEEVAEQLKIKKNTVYELVKRGDLPAYRVGRKLRIDQADVDLYKEKQREKRGLPTLEYRPASTPSVPGEAARHIHEAGSRLVLVGRDQLLDLVSSALANAAQLQVMRVNANSFESLRLLYEGKADVAAVHLWDGETGEYNRPYVKRFLPGVPAVLLHLACRMQGFYVKQGNPLHIRQWQDLTGEGIRFVNREKGAGTRVLLDEKLSELGIERGSILGYDHEEDSQLTVAGMVAQGEADVGMGNQKTVMQVHGVDFIPLQRERYDLVIRKSDWNQPAIQTLIGILRSEGFARRVRALGDYDTEETGKITEV